MKDEGHLFKVAILAPREVKGGDTIPLSGVVLPLNWKIAKRLEMVESARDLITNAYILDSLDHGLPTILRTVIEGVGLYEHSIGEFFELYGQFEGKYLQGKYLQRPGPKTRAKMETLVNGDRKYLKSIKVDRKGGKVEEELQPLPYAVRNILAHLGTSLNKLDDNGEELKISIELLRSWVRSEE